jgi:hypothetical protein
MPPEWAMFTCTCEFFAAADHLLGGGIAFKSGIVEENH